MRPLPDAFLTALRQPRIVLALLAEVELELTTLYAWTGTGTITFQGADFIGVGQLARVGPTEQTSDLSAAGLILGLNGLSLLGPNGESLIVLVERHLRAGGQVTCWLALFDPTTRALVADPDPFFAGLADAPTIEAGPDAFAVALSAESRIIRLKKPPDQRWNHETQIRYFPGDRGFEYASREIHKPDNFG